MLGEIEKSSMAVAVGIALLHFAKRLDVLIWPVKRVC
jgi:hypothetical protein